MNLVIDLVKNIRDSVEEEDGQQGFSEAVQVKLATAIALNLKVPSIPQGNANAAWNQLHYANIRKLVSDVNELFLLDVKAIIELIKTTFITRYNFVHAPNESMAELNLLINEASVKNDLYPEVKISVSDLGRIGSATDAVMRELYETSSADQ